MTVIRLPKHISWRKHFEILHMSVLNFFFQETKQKKNYDRLQLICKCLLGFYALRQRCATPLILILLQKSIHLIILLSNI